MPPTDPTSSSSLARFSRQILYEPIGAAGQQRLLDSQVTLIGCGALGTVLASTLVRAGVGRLRICDRDFIEADNLQRQVLFDEDDIAAQLPKAVAAARKLERVNPALTIEPHVTDVTYRNILELSEGADLILDGTDNFDTRYLINDVAVKTGRPWVYGAVIGATGLVMPIVPGVTPCLRCIFENAPPPGMSPTCDTAGVIGPAVNVVASMQAVAAMQLLCGTFDATRSGLLNIDVWTGRFTTVNVDSARRDGSCPCCGQLRFAYLDGEAVQHVVTLCGRNAVQVHVPRTGEAVDLSRLARRLEDAGAASCRHNAFMLVAMMGEHQFTVFPDGRAIIKGTDHADVARSLYARYLGG